MVVLCDYQSRKFQPRTPLEDEVLDSVATEVEDAICECKTKLNAAFARCRIKASVPSLAHLLPDTVRSKEAIGTKVPVYAWVNQVKTRYCSFVYCYRPFPHSPLDSKIMCFYSFYYMSYFPCDVKMVPGLSRAMDMTMNLSIIFS
jgi:hypothetical protein